MAVTAALLTLAAIVWRIRFGFDVADEGFYLAIPYRFALGDRPFVDETSILQLAAVLTLPFVKAYLALVGSDTGLVLAMRAVYVASMAAVGAVAFPMLRTAVRWPYALLASALPLAVIPFNIPSLSYNTIGAGLLTVGMVLGLRRILQGRGLGWLAAAGLAHGIAVVAYPSLVLVLPVYAAAAWYLRGRGGWRDAAVYGVGAAAIGALLLLLFARVGFSNVVRSVEYMASLPTYGGGGSKLRRIAAFARDYSVAQWPAFIAAGLIYGLYLVRGRTARLALPILPVLILDVRDLRYPSGATIVIAAMVGMAGLYLWLYLVGNAEAKPWVVWGLLPAFAAGLVTSCTSTNGALNAGIGLFPGLVVTPVLMVLASAEAGRTERARSLTQYAIALSLVVLLGGLVWRCYSVVYRDSSISELTATIGGGPYRGIRTTLQNARYAADLESDITREGRPGDRILFYDDLPGGYLFTSFRAATNNVWLSPIDNLGPNSGATFAYWARTENRPTIVVKNLVGPVYGPEHPIDSYINSWHFRVVLRRPDYVVYRSAD